VPIRLEIGQKEIAQGSVYMGRRDFAPNEKSCMAKQDFIAKAENILGEIQENLFARAKKFQTDNTITAHSKEEFIKFFSAGAEKSGFVNAYWIGDNATENELKQNLKVTARCVPLETKAKLGKCIFTGKDNAPLTLFARAY